MPELPDICIYLEALSRRIDGRRLERIRIRGPSLLRSVDPPPGEAEGRSVRGLRRLGKRIAIELEEEIFLVLHLMVAGRLRWWLAGAGPAPRSALASFAFDSGTLVLTEAGTRRRASLHVVRGEAALAEHDPGGLEVFAAGPDEFAARLTGCNHTLKRALTDPKLVSGIGNAYADEILHAAGLSPVALTQRLDPEALERLHRSCRETLASWIERLRRETGDRFPERVTAFREGMAVHGRYRQPCPRCGAPIQRIVYAEHETNYCAPCQTGGRLLADRALSRLLRRDWPRSLDELEARRGGAR